MKTVLKRALSALPFIAIGVGILAYVIANSPPPARMALSERATAVRVVTAKPQDIVPTVTGYGVVAPARTFEAIAEVGGRVDYVNPALQSGQILPAGAVLLRLSPVDFNLAIAQAEANMRIAQARLEELAVSEESQRTALAIEHDVLAVKLSDLDRAQALFEAGTMAKGARDAARAAHLAQRQKVQGIEGALALFPTQRAVQTEQVAVYATTLETARLNLARSEFILPFTARVAARSVEAGQYLRATQSAATLDGIDRAEIEVQLAMDAFRTLIRTAQPDAPVLPFDPARMSDVLHGLALTAQVRLRLGDEVVTWPAIVDRLADGIDQRAGTLGVVVVVEDAYAQTAQGGRPPLTKGMFVDVVLSGAPVRGVALPRSAVRAGQVFVADADNRLRAVPAKPQFVQGEVAVFTTAIDAGARVLVAPPVPPVAGQLLIPHEDADLVARLLAVGGAK